MLIQASSPGAHWAALTCAVLGFFVGSGQAVTAANLSRKVFLQAVGFTFSVCTKFFHDIPGELIFSALLLSVARLKIISVPTFFFFPTPPIFPLLGAELTEWKLKVEICVEPRISCYWNSLQTTEEWLCRGNKGEKVTKRSCCTILCIACGGDYIQTSVFSLSSSNLAFFSVFFHQTYQVWYIYQMKLSGVVLFRA